jgi:hypothetical protein
LPPRTSPLNPDGTLTISPEVIKSLRLLIEGVSEDKSPSTRVLKRVMEETNCNETDRDVILFILDLHEEF